MMPNLYALPRPPDVKVMHGAVLAPRSTIQRVFDKNEVQNAYSSKFLEIIPNYTKLVREYFKGVTVD